MSQSLVLIVTSRDFTKNQHNFIENYCGLMGMTFQSIVMNKLSDLEKGLAESPHLINHIFFTGHGDDEGSILGDSDSNFQWKHIIGIINEETNVEENCTFYLQSCESSAVSNLLLETCTRVKDIVSFNSKIVIADGFISIVNFLYYKIIKKLPSEDAIYKIQNSICPSIEYFTS